MMMRTSSLPDLTTEKTWTKSIKQQDLRFDSLESAVKAIQDTLKKKKKILAEDIIELSYVTYEAEVFTQSVTECMLEKDIKMKAATLKGMIRFGKRLTNRVSEALHVMFYLYLNPDEEIILLRLYKRIKYIIEKQRDWDLITTGMTTLPAKLSRLIDEEKFRKQKQLMPAVAKGFYFSDLPEEVLTILFCKGPLFQFELCTVLIDYGRFSKQPMLYGFIRAAESSVGQDGFVEVFNREENDPLVIPHSPLALLRDCFVSLPVSNPVQFHVKLHIKLDKVETYDDDDLYTDDDDDDDDDDDEDEVLTIDNDDDALEKDMKLVAERIKTALEKYSSEELEVAKDKYPPYPFTVQDLISACKDGVQRVEGVEMKNDMDEPFEVCDEYINISYFLAKRHNGCVGSYKTKGKDESLELCYVALKNTVDASLEIEFVGEKTKVVGWVMTKYGRGFDYGFRAEKHLYSITLFDTKSDNAFVIKPGKVNLTRSVLPVPAQFSLIISVYFRDNNTEYGARILDGSYEFLVPCDGSSSVASIVGNGCSVNLKVDWKLPFDHMRYEVFLVELYVS